MPLHGDYLRKRKVKGKVISQNWWLRLPYPGLLAQLNGGKHLYERSLRTPDRHEAELLAAPDIISHKKKLMGFHALKTGAFVDQTKMPWKLEPTNKPVLQQDGSTITATESLIIHTAQDGSIISAAPNVAEADEVHSKFELKSTPEIVARAKSIEAFRDDMISKHGINPDHAILDYYIEKKKFTAGRRKEIYDSYNDFKKLAPNKTLRSADFDDAEALFEHYYQSGAGNAHQTAKKKVNWLSQAIRFGKRKFKLTSNAFEGCVPPPTRADNDRAEKNKPVPLSEADMAVFRERMQFYPEDVQLLWVLCATTGMRLSEALAINRELELEHGFRRILIGEKTATSKRIIPIPQAVIDLPFFPKHIDGPLFVGSPPTGDEDAFEAFAGLWSNKMNDVLRALGIKHGRDRKVFHSLRHRAIDRLRAARCPQDVRFGIVGHEEETVHKGYGYGFAADLLNEHMRAIGF